MAKLSPLLAEWGSMKFLITEILLCLLAASILGLIIGWLCKAAFARDKLLHREKAWQKKYREIDDEHALKIKQSEKDSRTLTKRIEKMEKENHSLYSSLEANESAVHKAHIEVQQLSNRQKDTQGRLEKIIAEKDREISSLLKESARGKDSPPRPYGFSSNKPAEQPATPDRVTDRTPPPQPPRGKAGGIPQPGTIDTGFRPGTQTPSEDFDKTQLIDGHQNRAGFNNQDQHDTTLRNDPLDNPGGRTDRTEQTGAHAKGPKRSAPTGSGSSSQSGNRSTETRSTTTANDLTGSHDSTMASPARDSIERAADTVSDGKPRKRSLWDRVRESIGKDDKNKD